MKRRIIELLRWLIYILNDKTYSEFGTEIVGLLLFRGEIIVATKNAVFSSKDGKPPFKKWPVSKPTSNETETTEEGEE